MNGDDIYREIEEAVRNRNKEVKETVAEAAGVPKELPPPAIKSEMDAWRGAWLLVFTFFLAVTLAVTGLSVLVSGPSPFGIYWFCWGVLALLVIIYPVVLIINRRTGHH